MNKLLLFIILVSNIIVFAQDSCVVKVFPGDCNYCYIGMNLVERIEPDVKKTIVFPEMSTGEIDAYVKKVLRINDISNFHIVVSDSIYNSINNNLTSEVYVFNQDHLIDHTLLKKFSGIEMTNCYEIQIPDTIAISNASTIISNESFFFVSDYQFGDCLFISKYDNNRIYFLDSKELTTESNFYKIFGDSIAFKMFTKYQDVLNQSGMDKMQIRPAIGTKNDMVAFILAPDITGENESLSLSYKTGIIIFKNPADYTILTFDEASIPNNYIAYPGGISIYNKFYYIEMKCLDNTIDDQFLFGKFSKKGNTLVFNNFVDFKVPHEYLPAEKYKGLKKIFSFTNPYVLLQYSLTYYNLQSDQAYQLPFDSVNMVYEMPGKLLNLMKYETNYMLFDTFKHKDTLHIMYKRDDTHYISLVNLVNNEEVMKYEISNPNNSLKVGMYFNSIDEVYYLSKDNRIIIEKIEYKK